ncbi:MAG: VOC family protein [Rhizobiaceae bacterium]
MAQLDLTGIGHVALKVADIERSLAFYRDRLGFREVMRLNRDNGELWLVYLRITDTQFLELFPDGEGNEAPGAQRTGINHFCLETADIEATAHALREKGIALTVEPKMGADNNRQCWIADPDGNRIEFMQMMPNSMQMEAIRRLKNA